jgi:hypothetical protein
VTCDFHRIGCIAVENLQVDSRRNDLEAPIVTRIDRTGRNQLADLMIPLI